MLMPWHWAMMAILPLIFFGGRWLDLWEPKRRTWLVLMGASLATFIHQSHGFYIAINIIAAVLILSYPATQWQRAIGLVFVAMGFSVLGNYLAGLQNISSAVTSPVLLVGVLTVLGWVQFLVLLAWGGNDVLGRYRNRNGLHGADTAGAVEL